MHPEASGEVFLRPGVPLGSVDEHNRLDLSFPSMAIDPDVLCYRFSAS